MLTSFPQSHWRRGFLLASLLVCLAAALTILQVAASNYIQSRHEWNERVISNERTRRDNYRRVVVFPPSIDQNAAPLFRQAFDRLNSLPPDTVERLRPRVDRGTRAVPLSDRIRFRDRCDQLKSENVLQAFRSTRCDWELPDRNDGSGVVHHWPSTDIMAYCKALEGDRLANLHDWNHAAKSYLELAAFGSDLDQGTFGMNLAGLSSSLLAFQKLGELTASIPDKDNLSQIRQGLEALTGHLPKLTSGLRILQIWLATQLLEETTGYLAHQRQMGRGFLLLIPAAWNLAKSGPLLRSLEQAVDVNDTADRQQVLRLIVEKEHVRSDQLLRTELPPGWDKLIQRAESVATLFSAVQLTIRLQEWRLEHAIYPRTVQELEPQAVGPNLRYKPFADGSSYEIFADGFEGTLFRPSAGFE